MYKDEIFLENWRAAPECLKKQLQDYEKYPTERNSCYITGYMRALYENKIIEFEVYDYFLIGVHDVLNEKQFFDKQFFDFIRHGDLADKLNP